MLFVGVDSYRGSYGWLHTQGYANCFGQTGNLLIMSPHVSTFHIFACILCIEIVNFFFFFVF